MIEPRWLDVDLVLAIHDMQIAEHGGAPGIRDRGLLESALARAKNLFAYGEVSFARMAAAYAFGIARNDPFVDGNKRTALICAELFLDLNRYDLAAHDAAVVTIFLSLAAGDVDEEALAQWINDNSALR